MDDLTASKLQTAYELIKAGQRDQACKILIPLVRASPNLTYGWFLLGHAVSDSQEKIRCFQQVLRHDPANQPAQKQLARLLAPQAVSPLVGTKPVVAPRPSEKVLAEMAKKSAPKKQSPVLLWGFAGLAGLFICLSGFGLFRGFSNPLFASQASTVPSSATSILPTITLIVSTSTPEPSQPPKPTSKPTITMPPTPTPQPSLTMLPTLTLTFTETPSRTPGPKPKVFTGCVAPNGLGMLTAPFKIENFGKVSATVHIKGTSQNGNYPISCQAIVKQGRPVLFTLMWGNYEYIVFRGATTTRGSFFINQPYKATMRIFKDKIQIGPFP